MGPPRELSEPGSFSHDLLGGNSLNTNQPTGWFCKTTKEGLDTAIIVIEIPTLTREARLKAKTMEI